MRISCPLVPEAPEVCSAEMGKEKVSAVTHPEVTRMGASRRGRERDCCTSTHISLAKAKFERAGVFLAGRQA